MFMFILVNLLVKVGNDTYLRPREFEMISINTMGLPGRMSFRIISELIILAVFRYTFMPSILKGSRIRFLVVQQLK